MSLHGLLRFQILGLTLTLRAWEGSAARLHDAQQLFGSEVDVEGRADGACDAGQNGDARLGAVGQHQRDHRIARQVAFLCASFTAPY